MSLYSDRRRPMYLVRINGVNDDTFARDVIRLRFAEKPKHAHEIVLEVADAQRNYRDGFLNADDKYEIVWGYPGNMSDPRTFLLKNWETNHDAAIPVVKLSLRITTAIKSVTGSQIYDEPHKAVRPKNWGKVQSSDIARKIAKRYGMKAIVDDSDDADSTAFIQPANVTDYSYLMRHAENIDFEFFLENNALYYRKKPYDERPRYTFIYTPKVQVDTLLLTFTPSARTAVASTSPASSRTDRAEAKTGYASVAKFFSSNVDAVQSAIEDLTRTDLPEAFANADVLRVAVGADSDNVAKNKNYEARMADITTGLQEIRRLRKEGRLELVPAGKAALAQKMKPPGSKDASVENSQLKSGRPPLGNSEEKAREYDINARTRTGKYSESTVTTTAGTDKRRDAVTKASYQKRIDKAVTASATLIGDPSFRARVNYMFVGVGDLFSGSWYAKEVTHEISASGYFVTMTLKKGTLNKNKKSSRNNSNQNAQDLSNLLWVNARTLTNGYGVVAPSDVLYGEGARGTRVYGSDGSTTTSNDNTTAVPP